MTVSKQNNYISVPQHGQLGGGGLPSGTNDSPAEVSIQW